jgi:hypothetical protein
MYQDLFLYPAIGAFVLLILHSWKVRGRRFTLLFFIGGFAFGFVREFFYANFKHLYNYSGLSIKIFGVPPVIPLGWMFTFYIGLCFAERIFGFSCQEIANELQGADRAKADMIFIQRLLPLLISVATFTGIVCYAIESCAIDMKWWEFVGFHGDIIPNTVQYMWTQTSIIWTLLFFLAYFKQIRSRKNYVFWIVFTAKYISEDFVFQYIGPFGSAILWMLIMVVPLFFYHEFSIYYLLLLFGGEIYPRLAAAYFGAFVGNVLIDKLVFFVPQTLYFILHLHLFHKATRTKFTHVEA